MALSIFSCLSSVTSLGLSIHMTESYRRMAIRFYAYSLNRRRKLSIRNYDDTVLLW